MSKDTNHLIGHSLGRYHIKAKIGEGGMAVVYKARDEKLERDVALKLIHKECFPPEILDRMLKRFEREAKAMAQLSHPNLVKVLDFGEYEDAPYLVMEYLPGGSLDQMLGNPIPYREAARILAPVAQALADAHQHQMIHRDVKPSNILFTANKHPMLGDFGIVKLLDDTDSDHLTRTSEFIGTPAYMAPEQAVSNKVDARADIYALGVVFYEMLTGRIPYTADTPVAMLLKHAHEPLPLPRRYVRDLPNSVEKVLFKALAKNPDDRYKTIELFGDALVKLSNEKGGPSHPKAARLLVPTIEVDRTPIPDFRLETPQSGKNTNQSNSHLGNVRWIIALVLFFFGMVCIAALAIGGYQAFRVISSVKTTSTSLANVLTFTKAVENTPIHTQQIILPTDTVMPSAVPSLTASFVPTASRTRTVSVTPRSSATAAVTQAPQYFAIVSEKSVNVRSGPGQAFGVIISYQKDTKLEVIGRNQAGDWLVVLVGDDQKGWIFGNLLNYSFDISQLPVIQSPPPPVLPTMTPQERPPAEPKPTTQQPTPTELPPTPPPAEITPTAPTP